LVNEFILIIEILFFCEHCRRVLGPVSFIEFVVL
jgi:hypothetical protein